MEKGETDNNLFLTSANAFNFKVDLKILSLVKESIKCVLFLQKGAKCTSSMNYTMHVIT